MIRVKTNDTLERIRSGNLNYMDFATYLEIDLQNDVDVASLMHEIDVVNGAMVCWFMLQGYDINGKSIHGQTPQEVLENKLKTFLKQKKELEQNKVSSTSSLEIASKIRKTENAVKILKTVQELISLNDPFACMPSTADTFKDESDQLMVFDATELLSYLASSAAGEFEDSFMQNEKIYMDVAKMVANNYHKNRTERLNLQELLKRGGYDKVQIEKNAKNMSEKSLALLCKNDDGTPKLLYHGGLIPEYKNFLPLSHCGTFEAAYERLHNTGDDLKQNARMVPLYLKMKSPLRIPDLIAHNISGYKELVFYTWFQNQKWTNFIQKADERNKIKNLYLQQIFYKMKLPLQFDYIFDQPMRMEMKDVYDELSLRRIYSWDTSEDKAIREKNNRERLIYARLIRYFEQQGYDGFVYSNTYEDAGLDSYICFRREQFLVASDKHIEMKIQAPVYKNEKKLAALEAKQLLECKKTHLTPEEAKEYIFSMDKFIETTRRFRTKTKQSNSISVFWNKIKKFCRT